MKADNNLFNFRDIKHQHEAAPSNFSTQLSQGSTILNVHLRVLLYF